MTFWTGVAAGSLGLAFMGADFYYGAKLNAADSHDLQSQYSSAGVAMRTGWAVSFSAGGVMMITSAALSILENQEKIEQWEGLQ